MIGPAELPGYEEEVSSRVGEMLRSGMSFEDKNWTGLEGGCITLAMADGGRIPLTFGIPRYERQQGMKLVPIRGSAYVESLKSHVSRKLCACIL